VAGFRRPAAEDEPGLDWRRYLSALLRFKWLMLAVVAVGIVTGVVLARLQRATYVAQATIYVPTQQRAGATPLQPALLFDATGWIELLKTSFVVLDDVVRGLGLYLDAEPADAAALRTFGLKDRFARGGYELRVSQDGRTFELVTASGTVEQRGQVGDSVGPDLGFVWVPPKEELRPGRRIRWSLLPPRDAALELQKTLVARLADRGGSFLSLQLQGSNPERLAATVNLVAQGFVDTAKALTTAKQRELIRILGAQLDSAERKLLAAEVALEEFKVGTYTLPNERATPVAPGIEQTTNPALARYSAMKVELDELRRDADAIQAALAAGGESGVVPDALTYIGAVQASAELSAALQDLTVRQASLSSLRLRYTDENPEVLHARGEVQELRQRTIPTLARGLLGQLAQRERELDSRIGSAGRELQEIPRRSTEEQRLTREVTIADFRYQDVKRQHQDAVLAQSAEELTVRLLDAAVVPRRPIHDAAIRVFLMAAVASVGIAVVLAIILDRLDQRFRYPEQASQELGLTILGAIPRVKSGGGAVVDPRQAGTVIEALRGVRLGIAHAFGAAGPLMITVTSPGPGEGKSFVVSNLALAFADGGHRTILIDGDVRRGDLHRPLGAQRRPGLTDYLKGDVPWERAVQTTRYDRLHFLGGGTRLHVAPELLSSPAMQQLLLGFRGAYDVILLDSPPLSAGVDPFILGAATGNLLLVLRTGVTNRELAEAKLDVLDRLPIRVLGAVLNDVRPQGEYRYYGYQYYVEGYETQDEVGEVSTLPGVPGKNGG
jgi:tyrosine-protein kinase Etk/Wzc